MLPTVPSTETSQMPQPSSLPPIQPGPALHPTVPAYIPAEPVRKANGWAIASIIAGLLGWLPFLPGVVAIVAGAVGVRRSRDDRHDGRGRGLAVAGILLGVVSLVAWSLGGMNLGRSLFDFARGETTGEPLRVASAFLDYVSAGEVDAAMALAGPGLSREQIAQWAEAAQAWGTFKQFTAFDRTVETHAGVSVADFEGTAEFAGDPRPVSIAISLMKQGDKWQVTDVRFP
jgi:hypothetical protein